MQILTISCILVLIGIAVASDSLNRRKRNAGDSSVGQARIDAHEMRMSKLNEMLAELKEKVRNGYNDDPIAMLKLNTKLTDMEGNNCPVHRKFSCGRLTGQCCNAFLVCDGIKDCENGYDEDEDLCASPVDAGAAWAGEAIWTSCRIRAKNKFSFQITGNERLDHFMSRLWVEGLVTESYIVGDKEVTENWPCSGNYDYSNGILLCFPPKDSPSRIGIKCLRSDPQTAKCELLSVTGELCGYATISDATA